MSYRVALRSNATDEVRLVTLHEDWDELSEHLWLDGEYACDCVRGRLFEGQGARMDVTEERECGSGEFAALYAELPDGRRVSLEGAS